MFHRSLLALAVTLLIASSAYAETIFITPALAAPLDGALQCRVVNGSTTKTIEFVSQIFDFNGNVLSNPADNLETLAALTVSVGATDAASARYCIVTLVHEPKTKVRISISISDSSNTTITALEGRP